MLKKTSKHYIGAACDRILIYRSGSGVHIRLLEKLSLRNISLTKNSEPVEFVGRLQLWDRNHEQGLEVIGNNATYALRGLTNMSQTTVRTNATIRVAEALPLAQISAIDGNEVIITHQPSIPLLVLLKESPEKSILALSGMYSHSYQIFFESNANPVPPPPKTRVDVKLCQCRMEGSDCPRCFIRDVQSVDLKVGKHEFPKERDVKDWVEVKLGSGEGSSNISFLDSSSGNSAN